MKRCIACKNWKDAQDFGKKASGKDGLQARCRECRKIDSRKYYESNVEKFKMYHIAHAESKLEYMKQYRKDNKERLNTMSRKYMKENYETIRETRKNNPEWDAKYRRTEKGRNVAYKGSLKRRSYKHKVIFKPHERTTILERDNWTCQCCGIKVNDNKETNPQKAEIDHIIPISKGGNSEPSNLQILCRTCNRRKSSAIQK
jgi:5-methylcytosine-specific restriction endonuclease McrA